MRLLRELDEGCAVPRGWGFCWHRWDACRNVIAPLGLNVLFAFTRWCWLWTAFDATRWLRDNEPPRQGLLFVVGPD